PVRAERVLRQPTLHPDRVEKTVDQPFRILGQLAPRLRGRCMQKVMGHLRVVTLPFLRLASGAFRCPFAHRPEVRLSLRALGMRGRVDIIQPIVAGAGAPRSIPAGPSMVTRRRTVCDRRHKCRPGINIKRSVSQKAESVGPSEPPTTRAVLT